jgi:mRNA-degrading endonuclease RelE of RelBE toxin-antitoxin system
MSFEVETIPYFEKEFKSLLKKYPSLKKDLLELVLQLELDPTLGVALGKNFYKIRINITSKNKGRSGGGRVITCVKVTRSVVYLGTIYDKSEKVDVTDKELKILAAQIG